MNQKLISYFRWFILLPGAIIAGFLATFPLHWVLWLLNLILSSSGEPDPLSIRFFLERFTSLDFNLIERALSPLVISATFIWAGSKIAPKYKFKAALTLFGIYVISWSWLSFSTLFKGSAFGIDAEFSVRTILGLVGAILGLYQSWRSTKVNLDPILQPLHYPPAQEERRRSKKLMFLISTEGKTPQQISKEAWAAYQKYQQASNQPKSSVKSGSSQKPTTANTSAEIYFTPNYSRGPKKYSQKQANPSWAQELSDNLRRNLLREDEDPNYNPPL